MVLLLSYRPLKPPTLLIGYAGAGLLLLPAPGQLSQRRGEVFQIRGAAAAEDPLRTVVRAPSASVVQQTVEEAHVSHGSTMPPLPEIAPVKARTGGDAFSEAPPPEARPRVRPEIQADPRTVYKQRGRATETRLAPREPVAPMQIADGPVMDLIIVPQLPGFRASEHGIKAVVGYLRTTQILTAKHQKSLPDGATVVELLPDVFVHLAFFDDGGAPPGPPAIAEALLWSGVKPAPLPFGPKREACFRLELVGVRFPRVSDAFLARLNSILYLKAELVAVPHDPKRLRRPAVTVAAEPIPRFDVQER